jgi:hypothetical protein
VRVTACASAKRAAASLATRSIVVVLQFAGGCSVAVVCARGDTVRAGANCTLCFAPARGPRRLTGDGNQQRCRCCERLRRSQRHRCGPQVGVCVRSCAHVIACSNVLCLVPFQARWCGPASCARPAWVAVHSAAARALLAASAMPATPFAATIRSHCLGARSSDAHPAVCHVRCCRVLRACAASDTTHHVRLLRYASCVPLSVHLGRAAAFCLAYCSFLSGRTVFSGRCAAERALECVAAGASQWALHRCETWAEL